MRKAAAARTALLSRKLHLPEQRQETAQCWLSPCCKKEVFWLLCFIEELLNPLLFVQTESEQIPHWCGEDTCSSWVLVMWYQEEPRREWKQYFKDKGTESFSLFSQRCKCCKTSKRSKSKSSYLQDFPLVISSQPECKFQQFMDEASAGCCFC